MGKREVLEILSRPEVQIGEPVKSHTPWRHRYAQAPVAIANGAEEVMRLVYDKQFNDPADVNAGLAKGRMPRRGGIIRDGEDRYCSYDLMAARLSSGLLELNPSLKSSVDPDTKIPRASGLILMTHFTVGASVDVRGIMPIAVAFNPDEEPWRADYFSAMGQRIRQNECGIAIAQLDVLRFGGIERQPTVFDPKQGSTAIYLG